MQAAAVTLASRLLAGESQEYELAGMAVAASLCCSAPAYWPRCPASQDHPCSFSYLLLC